MSGHTPGRAVLHERVGHIRRRLRRSRSTNRYLDTSDRGTGTFCGAPETDVDWAWAERNRANPTTGCMDGERFRLVPCDECAAVAKAEGGAS